MLLNRHGDALLRIKGTLNVADAATPVAVHAVRHLVHTPRHLEAWPDADRLSRLVFIARGGVRSGGIDRLDDLEDLYHQTGQCFGTWIVCAGENGC